MTEFSDHIFTKSANRCHVIPQTFQTLADPARDFSPTHVRKAGQLGIVGDGHDPRDDRQFDAQLFTVIHKMKVGIGIEEVLRNGAVRSGLYLTFKVQQILAGIGGLGVDFWIGRHLDMKVIAGFMANEFDQFVGVAKFSCIPEGISPRKATMRLMPLVM